MFRKLLFVTTLILPITTLGTVSIALGDDSSKPVVEPPQPPAPLPQVVARPLSSGEALTAARISFKSGDYMTALQTIETALEQSPDNLDLVEFRGLALFAKGDYFAASTSIHKIVANRSGWNWATVYRMYPDLDTYTLHLRTLESYSRKHPDDTSSRFLQAYHYNLGGYPSAAVRELQMVVRLDISDVVAVNFLRRVSEATAQPAVPRTSAAWRY